MYKFLERQTIKTESRRNRQPKETYNKHRDWISNKNPPTKENPGWDGFTPDSTKHLKKN